MLWWIAIGVFVLLLGGLLVFRRTGIRERMVELPSPHPRPLEPHESAAGERARQRALESIRAAQELGDAEWQGFDPAAYPYVDVLADRQRADVHWVRFSTRIWYVPAGGEVITAFEVGVTSRGLDGNTSFSLDVNDTADDAIQPEFDSRFEQSFWRKADEATAALAFVDRALRRHGDFGVYGNLSAGIQALAREGCTVGVRQDRQGYAVRVDPIDGHGHFHHFQVLEDGSLGQPACGHYEPMRPHQDEKGA